MAEKTVTVAGSTGSIGTQAVDVIERSSGRFRAVALAARRSVDELAAQARRLRPELVVIEDPALASALRRAAPSGVDVMAGPEGLAAAVGMGDVVVNGVVGFAGLPVTLGALEAGKRLALANKQSLIAAAPLVREARRRQGAEIVPVDSEHCALHQCLSALGPDGAERAAQVARLIVTASGGPFRGRRRDELEGVSVADALTHPTWSMGPQNTIDSSTLMNKGLEVIEAHELFEVPYERIEVLVHPQSIVHSMVELVDGSTLAQASLPDMRLPIGYAMGWPRRLDTAFGPLDWSAPLDLHFEPPDRKVFRCLDLATAAGRAGGGAPAWLNAANEVAVSAFLAGRLPWLAIAAVVGEALEAWDAAPLDCLDDVLDTDRRARQCAESIVRRRQAAA